jgi:hypothetical protein
LTGVPGAIRINARALDIFGDVGLTVLDAEHPSLQTAVQYGGVLLGSLR